MSPVQIWDSPVQSGPLGLFLGPFSIIQTVHILGLVEYIIPVKNHVDRITDTMYSDYFCLEKNGRLEN
ncbi:unnamed protein product [Camellia sinensis]